MDTRRCSEFSRVAWLHSKGTPGRVLYAQATRCRPYCYSWRGASLTPADADNSQRSYKSCTLPHFVIYLAHQSFQAVMKVQLLMI